MSPCALLDQVCGARLPLSALPLLAGLRRLDGVVAKLDADWIWLCWQAGDEEITGQVLPVPGVELFVREDGFWKRFGSRLPSFGLPMDSGMRPLYQALLPAPVETEEPTPLSTKARRITLVRSDQERKTTALACELSTLVRWAERATSNDLASLQAAWSERQVVVRGTPLPLLSNARRYWGGRLLVPIGYGADPALPEAALLEALGVADEEIAILGAEQIELIPMSAFGPVTRAGIRLATTGSH
jgi:hypothetical protein